MKLSYITKILAAAICLISINSTKVTAQETYDKISFSIGWQANAPINTDFTDQFNGWGMNFEVNYAINNRWSLGGFFNFNTNHNYIDRQTIKLSDTESLTTDQLRSMFQLPFGLTTSYKLWNSKIFQPYVGAKAGAAYAKATTYYGTGGLYDKQWGFYVSPEIGAKVYPFKNKRFGFHIAGFYSFSTNKLQTLTNEINGLNNAGFRLGVLF